MNEPKKQIKVKTPKPKKLADEKTVELISYSIKMVIPTGQYANVQPEIVVKAGTMEEAHAYITPHMNKLWKDYYMISEKRTEQPAPVVTPTVVKPPASSVSFNKASHAIRSCMSVEALELIKKQIEASVKLTESDKIDLIPVLEEKYDNLVH